jgi:hypothetical protein
VHPPHPQPPTPKPFNWGRWAAWTALAAAVAFLTVGGITRLAHHDAPTPAAANPAACKNALAANYRKAMTDPAATTPAAPAACAGLDEETLKRITGEVVSEYLDSSREPAHEPTATATGAEACRAAIKAQYEPGTAKLKSTPSRPAECAGLSDDEVSQIVLDVIADNTR